MAPSALTTWDETIVPALRKSTHVFLPPILSQLSCRTRNRKPNPRQAHVHRFRILAREVFLPLTPHLARLPTGHPRAKEIERDTPSDSPALHDSYPRQRRPHIPRFTPKTRPHLFPAPFPECLFQQPPSNPRFLSPDLPPHLGRKTNTHPHRRPCKNSQLLQPCPWYRTESREPQWLQPSPVSTTDPRRLSGPSRRQGRRTPTTNNTPDGFHTPPGFEHHERTPSLSHLFHYILNTLQVSRPTSCRAPSFQRLRRAPL